MEKDTVFVPNRKPEEQAAKPEPTLLEKIMDHTAADAPIFSMISLAIHQLFGWPAYILLNAGAGVNSMVRSNRKETPKYKQSHLDPTSDVFTASEQPFVLLSNIGILALFTALYQVSKSLGALNTFLLYGLPYLWMNHWIGKLSLVSAQPKNSKTNIRYSCHYLPAPHSSRGVSLRGKRVDFRQGCPFYC
jgi:hypothetical protein